MIRIYAGKGKSVGNEAGRLLDREAPLSCRPPTDCLAGGTARLLGVRSLVCYAWLANSGSPCLYGTHGSKRPGVSAYTSALVIPTSEVK